MDDADAEKEFMPIGKRKLTEKEILTVLMAVEDLSMYVLRQISSYPDSARRLAALEGAVRYAKRTSNG